MNRTIRIAGFGGQGVMLLGQIIAATASNEGLNSIWVPTYGPETRGGTANCMVTISDKPIYSPIFTKADDFIAMNEPSLVKYGPMVKEHGLILYNRSLIKDVAKMATIDYVGIDANDIAASLGESKVLNMVVLGAYIAKIGLFSNAAILKTLAALFGEKKQHLLVINEKALELGRLQVQK